MVARMGGVDGVALETEKWIRVLEEMGCSIHLLMGETENQFRLNSFDIVYPIMSFFSEECYTEQDLAFYKPEKNCGRLLTLLKENAKRQQGFIESWIKQNQFDLVIIENIGALPSHISLGMAVKNLVQKIDCPFLFHDHDFPWERGDRYKSSHREVNELIKETFPIINPKADHAVINEFCKEYLEREWNTKSIKVPNVFDFDKKIDKRKERSQEVRKFFSTHKNPGDFFVEDDEKLLFQVTRIVRRKKIETAIELMDHLREEKVKLIIAGDSMDDYEDAYKNELLELTKKLKLENRVRFAPNVFCRKRIFQRSARAPLSLDDAYAAATACTYFSSYEGFGNAFIEAVWAKVPIFVNNYKPVFEQDIGCHPFRLVVTENNELTLKNIREISDILSDKELQKEIGEHNYKIGKEHFSFDVLRDFFRKYLKKKWQ
eukprot:XP_019921159.1 PREDICTED: uncharacterized protein LOC109618254 [Crassostrea gigas]